jgi:rubrerythrin
MPNDRCQPIREQIRTTEEGIREAEEILPELVGPVKTAIQNFIKQEKIHLRQLRIALKACEAR